MKRRDLLKSFAGLATAGTAYQTSMRTINPFGLPVKKYGIVTVESHVAHAKTTGEHLHVFVDGHDVTRMCCYADDEAGYVILYCQDPEEHKRLDRRGAKHLDSNRISVCRLRLDGAVVIVPGPKP